MASVVLPQTAPRWSRWSLLSLHAPGDAIAAYADGELPAADVSRVERHLAACPACHTVLAGHQRVGAALRALPTLRVPEALGPALSQRLRAAVR